MTEVTYHCSNCREETVSRPFDVSHLTLSCPSCGAFARFVHGGVLGKVEEFDDSPPPDLDWDRLDRRQKLVVAEGLVRRGRSPADYETTGTDEA